MKLKYGIALVMLIWLALPIMTRSAFAITAEVAKNCKMLTDKAFPLRVPGNPAAGLSHGTAQAASAYFRKCVANGGNVKSSEKEKPPQGTK